MADGCSERDWHDGVMHHVITFSIVRSHLHRGRGMAVLLSAGLLCLGSPALTATPDADEIERRETSAIPHPATGPECDTAEAREVHPSTCIGASRLVASFDRLDRNGDGRLTREDTRRLQARRDRATLIGQDRHILRFDLDRDGRATRQELLSAASCGDSTAAVDSVTTANERI
jgi:EF hand